MKKQNVWIPNRDLAVGSRSLVIVLTRALPKVHTSGAVWLATYVANRDEDLSVMFLLHR